MLGILAISLIVFAVLAGLLAKEVLLTKKASRRRAELDANIIHADVWIREEVTGENGKRTTEFVLLDRTKPLWRVNSHLRQPEPFETQAHIIEHAPRQIALQASTVALQGESSLDLLTIFTQSTQSYAIIAGQHVGKTFQARRIAQHWISTGSKPVVIGPKWDKGEWEGCVLFGGQYNFEQVSRGMRIVKQLAQDRHTNENLSHKQHPIQPIFFDDWTAIRAHLLDESEAFILDATTLYASVNIILYFMIHLDTANAWGVGKVGAALHQNFYKLFIEPGMNEAGLIDRSRNVGYVLYPGQSKKDRKRVALFGGTGNQLLLPDLVIQPTTDEEQAILDMVKGGTPYQAISQTIWGEGKFGQFYNKKIDRIVEKYS